MPEHREIYQRQAERYQQLVGREDYQNNLLPAILSIDTLYGKDVVEMGAGTGRVSVLVVPLVQSLLATDISHPMLKLGKRRLGELNLDNWHLSLASHRVLPFASDIADVIIAGWSFCYAALDAQQEWQFALERALGEVQRVLRPDGKLILIESLGTGYETPHPPDVLIPYLNYLDTHHFQSAWIRTDYCFKDRTEAEDLINFFFGNDPLPMWETDQGVIVPECTGLWWNTLNNPE